MNDNGGKVVKVLISIPNEGHPPCESYANRLENFLYLGKLQERTHKFEFSFLTLGRIFTPLAREEATDCMLENDFDYLFMIDDDMICPNRLFEDLYNRQVDIVGPLAFTRNYPHHPVIYDVKEGWDPKTQSYYYINHFIDHYKKDSLIECDAIGFGSVLVSRRVIEKMAKPRFMCSSGSGEDILFCNKAKKLGFKVFMDTSIKLGHLSHPIEVTEAYMEKVRKEFGYQEPIPLVPKRKTVDSGEALLILGD